MIYVAGFIISLVLFSGCGAKPKIDFNLEESIHQGKNIPTSIELDGILSSISDAQLRADIATLLRRNTAFRKGHYTVYINKRRLKLRGYGYKTDKKCSSRRYGDRAISRYIFKITVSRHTIFLENKSVCEICMSNNRKQYLDNKLLKESDINPLYPASLPVCNYTDKHVQEFVAYLSKIKEDLQKLYTKEYSFKKRLEELLPKYPQLQYLLSNRYKMRYYSKYDLSKPKELDALLKEIDQDIEKGIKLDLTSYEDRRDKYNNYYMLKEIYQSRYGLLYVSSYKNGRVPYVSYKIGEYYEKKGENEKALQYYKQAQKNGINIGNAIARVQDKIRYEFYYKCKKVESDAAFVNCSAEAEGMGAAFGNVILERALQNNSRITKESFLNSCKEYIYYYKMEQTRFGGKALSSCLNKLH